MSRSQFALPRPLQTANFLAAWLVPWRPAFLTSASRSKLRFYVSPRDVIGRHIAKYGSHEPHLTAWIEAFLNRSPRGIVLDVGANVGWHTVHAARNQRVETVVAFEPDALNAWLLDRNLTINAVTNALVVPNAVGARNGTARLNRYKGSNNGRHSIAVDHGLSSRVVPLTTIDDALRALQMDDKPVLLMKVDVEGYEPAVIHGAIETLKRTTAIVTEFSPELSADGTLNSMIVLLTSLGFRAHRLQSSGRLTAVTSDDLIADQRQTDIIWLSEKTPSD